jgi:antitoxin component of MazEF toxin-antitoxin module
VCLAAAALIALASCRGSGSDSDTADDEHSDDFGGLITSADPDDAVDVDRAATDPVALVRALRLPHHRVAELLGPHVFHATSSVDVAVAGGEGVGAPAEKLDVTARIEYADATRFHAVVENSADYGREIILSDGHLYLRPRYGAFHRRAPENEQEPAGWRDDIFSELSGHLQLFATGLAVRDGGAIDVAGRPARRIELSRASEPRQVRVGASPQRAWRSSAEVESLSGEILLDSQTGVPLRARIEGVVNARRDERPVRIHVIVEHAIEAIGQPVTITVPPEEEWVSTPVRSRELKEREHLLEDIAQPARPAPTPENTSTGAGTGAGSEAAGGGGRRAGEGSP